MGTMAATAAGSIAGHYISDKLFGHGAAPPQQAQMQQMAQQMPQSDPCRGYFDSYGKCLEQGEANSCSWAWDLVTKCRSQNPGA